MKILLVDDDPDSRSSIAKFLGQLGHEVLEADSAPRALSLLTERSFPLVLSDIRMPGMSGIELLKAVTALPSCSETSVVLLTGYGDMDSAIDAFRAGAFDYLLKPIKVKELALLTAKIEAQTNSALKPGEDSNNDNGNGLERKNPQGNLSGFKQAVFYSGLNKIGIFSESMLWLVKQAYLYHQDRSIPVLIQGETGTGKEVIARIIHFGAGDETAPFVAINCAAITPSLFESELFGYEPGAFTGGISKGQKGKCDLAARGTLLLDEVGEIPLELQGKLLRAIQERAYYRVGGLQEIKMDVRIICSTNADLDEMVKKGTFRKDLFYRLKVGSLFIPPLRQRKEDILPLGNLFLWEFSQQKNKRFKNIGNQAAKIMLNYAWPGNVRELRNLMEWIVFMFDDIEVRPQHLNLPNINKYQLPAFLLDADEDDDPEPPSHRKTGGKEFSEEILLQALEAHNGNKTEAARFLGISRTTLYNYLKNSRKE